MVLVQKWLFFQNFFLGNIGHENFFYDNLELKNAFPAYKKQEVQKVENGHLSKAVTHGFCPIMAIFPNFFLGNIGQENVFYDILEQEQRHSRL